mgnify:CR=1 FL=1
MRHCIDDRRNAAAAIGDDAFVPGFFLQAQGEVVAGFRHDFLGGGGGEGRGSSGGQSEGRGRCCRLRFLRQRPAPAPRWTVAASGGRARERAGEFVPVPGLATRRGGAADAPVEAYRSRLHNPAGMHNNTPVMRRRRAPAPSLRAQ